MSDWVFLKVYLFVPFSELLIQIWRKQLLVLLTSHCCLQTAVPPQSLCLSYNVMMFKTRFPLVPLHNRAFFFCHWCTRRKHGDPFERLWAASSCLKILCKKTEKQMSEHPRAHSDVFKFASFVQASAQNPKTLHALSQMMKTRRKILMFEKLAPANFWQLSLKNDRNSYFI